MLRFALLEGLVYQVLKTLVVQLRLQLEMEYVFEEVHLWHAVSLPSKVKLMLIRKLYNSFVCLFIEFSMFDGIFTVLRF